MHYNSRPLGHTKIESTVRYLGVEIDDAIDDSCRSRDGRSRLRLLSRGRGNEKAAKDRRPAKAKNNRQPRALPTREGCRIFSPASPGLAPKAAYLGVVVISVLARRLVANTGCEVRRRPAVR